METSAFYYDLPQALIAQLPAARRDEARLMALRSNTGEIEHRLFKDLPSLLSPGDILVLNDSKVIPGRLTGLKPTGGRIEITLIGRVQENKNLWRCLAKPARRLKAGVPLSVIDPLSVGAALCGRPNYGRPHRGAPTDKIEGLSAVPIRRELGGAWVIELRAEGNVMEALEKVGSAPLPPYIHRKNTNQRAKDLERYQTVYAKKWGAAAAPTAGMHFTPELMDAARNAGVKIAFITLEVGWGSFAPIRENTIEKHRVEAERFKVSEESARDINEARKAGGRVIAVGTTSARALESAWSDNEVKPSEDITDLFIAPGYRFHAVDVLITNFHLPRSSLIMLAAAFAGLERLLDAYREAVRKQYRFYSYGDAMIIL